MQSRGLRRLAIAMAILAVLVGIWAVLGFYAAPRLLRSVALDTVRERMHRELKLGEIRFNPFLLELQISDAQLPDQDGSNLVGFKRLVVRAELLRSAWNRGVSLSKLELDGLAADAVIRKDGSINLADLAQLAGPGKPAVAPPAPSAPLRLQVDRLAITSGELGFRELDRPSPFRARLMPIRLELHNFSTVNSTGNDYHFAARSEAGETLDWSGHLFLAPLRSDGNFRIGTLRTATIANYLGDALPLSLSSGIIDLTGNYNLAAGAGPVQISAAVTQLDVKDLGLRPRSAGSDYVHLDLIRVTGARADVAKRTAVVDSIQISGGTVHGWLTPAGQLNLMELAGTTPAPAAPQPAAQPAGVPNPWRYGISQIAVDKLAIEATDQGTQPQAQLRLGDIAAKVTGFSSDDKQPLAVSLSLRVNDSGQMQVDGQLLPGDASFKGKLVLADVDLRPVQPYLQRSTDMTLLRGKLEAKLDVERSAKGTLLARGDAAIHDLRTVDNFMHQDFVKWERLQARGIEYQSVPQRLRVHEVLAKAPYATVIVGKDRTLNITHILNPKGKAVTAASPSAATPAHATPTHATRAPTAPATPAAPMDMAIDLIRIEKASAHYADFWIRPNFEIGLVDLGGTVKGLSSKTGSRAKVDLRGTVDNMRPP